MAKIKKEEMDIVEAGHQIAILAHYFGIEPELFAIFIAKHSTKNTATADAKKAKKSKKK